MSTLSRFTGRRFGLWLLSATPLMLALAGAMPSQARPDERPGIASAHESACRVDPSHAATGELARIGTIFDPAGCYTYDGILLHSEYDDRRNVWLWFDAAGTFYAETDSSSGAEGVVVCNGSYAILTGLNDDGDVTGLEGGRLQHELVNRSFVLKHGRMVFPSASSIGPIFEDGTFLADGYRVSLDGRTRIPVPSVPADDNHPYGGSPEAFSPSGDYAIGMIYDSDGSFSTALFHRAPGRSQYRTTVVPQPMPNGESYLELRGVNDLGEYLLAAENESYLFRVVGHKAVLLADLGFGHVGQAISDLGQVAGVKMTWNEEWHGYAVEAQFIYRNGRFEYFVLPGDAATQGVPFAINDEGVVAGTFFTLNPDTGTANTSVYQRLPDGRIVDIGANYLRDVSPVPAPYYLLQGPFFMNNRGEVVGLGEVVMSDTPWDQVQIPWMYRPKHHDR